LEYAVKALAVLALGFLACCALAADGDQDARTTRLYTSYCYSCHGTGWQGAPMSGIAGEWQARMEKGWDSVLKNVQVGVNGMPAKGTCDECSTADFRAVIEMMMTEQK
jgi:cytochrome c5